MPTSAVHTNEASLVEVGLLGRVSHPRHTGAYAVDRDDLPAILPGMSGVTPDIRVGSPVFGFACDHGEAGVSADAEGEAANLAFQVLACLGNQVTVLSGSARGARGTVAGKHAYVLIDFPQDALEQILPGDRLLVRSCGQGLAILDAPEVACRNCSPLLLNRLGVELTGPGAISVAVAAQLAPEVMGAGLGMDCEWANCDVMLHDRDTVRRLQLEDLRVGDLVGMPQQDHRFGRRYDPRYSAVGVVVHALGPSPGHGVGVVTLLSGPRELLSFHLEPGRNLVDLLGLPR
jgi:hypothetical protein